VMLATGMCVGADALTVRAEELVRVVRLMLAHGRVVRQVRQETTQCPLRTGSMVRGPG
jgi:hypothetical protein